VGRPRVTTLTLNPAVDVGLVVDELMADHKMLASSVRREPGGGRVNVARSLNRLGAACTR
jgi:6-phosphofructokinase 2